MAGYREPAHWAIIIGINFYPNERCLYGSVRDAEILKQYVEQDSKPVDISLFSASTPEGTSTRPPERPDLWPTRANIISCLRRVIKEAETGDFVYFHFSGHGSQRRPRSPLGPDNALELALVLYAEDNVSDSHIRGPELASAFDKLVRKGVLLTVVLDCCFSGSVVRDDDNADIDVRCLPYDPSIDVPSAHDTDEWIFRPTADLRASHLKKDWLINPEGYTILSACGPYEKAFEVNIDGKGRRGALSHYLHSSLCLLRNTGVTVSVQTLHEHIRALFHASWPQQTPMRYGSDRLSFFGFLTDHQVPSLIPLYGTGGAGSMRLGAGEIHGVCEGDEFSVHPPALDRAAASETVDGGGECITVRAKAVRAFDSDVEVVSNATRAAEPLATGWRAKPVSSLSPRRIRVRLAANIPERDRWAQAAAGISFLELVVDPQSREPCMFLVKLSIHDELEVCDASSEEAIDLPSVHRDSNEAIGEVLILLQHLAKFKYFEGIGNRLGSNTHLDSYSTSLNMTPDPSSTFHIQHGDEWCLTVHNHSNRELYVTLLDLGACWEIINLTAGDGGGDYRVIPPRQSGSSQPTSKNLRVGIDFPDALRQRGKSVCQGMLKVFVTSRPLSFSFLTLPTLIEETRSNRRGSGLEPHRWAEGLRDLSSGPSRKRGDGQWQWACHNYFLKYKL